MASVATEEPFRWFPIMFGEYYGLTLPELMFTDIRYFYRAYDQNRFWGKLGHQAVIVANRAEHIRPPGPKPYSRQFGIVLNEENSVEEIVLLKKAKRDDAKKGPVQRLDHLNLGIIRQFTRSQPSVSDKLIECLKKSFLLPGTLMGPQQFFEVDAHFDLTCRIRHYLESVQQTEGAESA